MDTFVYALLIICIIIFNMPGKFIVISMLVTHKTVSFINSGHVTIDFTDYSKYLSLIIQILLGYSLAIKMDIQSGFDRKLYGKALLCIIIFISLFTFFPTIVFTVSGKSMIEALVMSVPGALSEMLIVSMDYGMNVEEVLVFHISRLIMFLIILKFLIDKVDNKSNI